VYVLINSWIGLVTKRHTKVLNQTASCYPSFIQLRKFDFLSINNRTNKTGLKKIRKIEQSTEFAQIKEYVKGDNYRHINWKASAKGRDLMVNQFQAERSQNIYCVIDSGRAMEMPFNDLSLLDYAINASLVMTSTAIQKDDRAGLLTFSRTPEKFLKASDKKQHVKLIIDHLHNLNTDFLESDFGRLYKFINSNITTRSLLLLYTNFETYNAFERQIKHIRALAKRHVLVLIFFENIEVSALAEQTPNSVTDHYKQTLAQQLMYQKKQMVLELNKYGIHALLTKPEHLTINSVNKYLEIKSRGGI